MSQHTQEIVDDGLNGEEVIGPDAHVVNLRPPPQKRHTLEGHNC